MWTKKIPVLASVLLTLWLSGHACLAQDMDADYGGSTPDDGRDVSSQIRSMLPPVSNEPAVDPVLEEAKRAYGRSSSVPAEAVKHDYLAPTIKHTPLEWFKKYADITFRATVTDNNPGVMATVFYRVAGTKTPYYQAVMERTDGDEFQFILPAAEVKDRPLEYYIVAADANGNKNYTIINIDRPHRIRLREGNPASPVFIIIGLAIVCSIGGIWIFRKYQAASEARRADEIKKFITRQKQLKKESKKAFKRNIQRMQSGRRSAAQREDGIDIEEDSSEEVDTAAPVPPSTETKRRGKGSSGGGAKPTGKGPRRASPAPAVQTPAATQATAPPPATRGEKIDDLLRKLDEKLATKEPASASRFDLKSEADELLDDDRLFGASKPAPPVKGSAQPPKSRIEWESIDRTLEDLFGKGDLSDPNGK